MLVKFQSEYEVRVDRAIIKEITESELIEQKHVIKGNDEDELSITLSYSVILLPHTHKFMEFEALNLPGCLFTSKGESFSTSPSFSPFSSLFVFPENLT